MNYKQLCRMRQFRDSIYYLTDDNQIMNINTGKIKKPSKTKQGYVVYALYYEGRVWTTYLHRFIKEIFHGPSHLEVDHLNKVKDDNRLENLEYVTRRENSLRGFNVDSSTRGINKSNGYYRYYIKNVYCRGSNTTSLSQIKKFKKEYDEKHNPWK